MVTPGVVRDRLVVGQLTLDQSTVVRIHVPEPLLEVGVRQRLTPLFCGLFPRLLLRQSLL
jgi:hypothetical protein